jgi:hypothetical protein
MNTAQAKIDGQNQAAKAERKRLWREKKAELDARRGGPSGKFNSLASDDT